MQAIVLASGSIYRQELVSRLGIKFQCISPDIDESAHAGEHAATLAQRLALQKAQRAHQLLDTKSTSNTIVIASDQVACVANKLLGKPLSPTRAVAQLTTMNGKVVEFHTALSILNTATGEQFSAIDITYAKLRNLGTDEIERYIAFDKPFDCAGSFKMESLGISLFESIKCEDPTALIGLPLIKVCEGLRLFGVSLP